MPSSGGYVCTALILSLRRRPVCSALQTRNSLPTPRAKAGVLHTQDADYLRLHRSGAVHAGIAYARQGRSIGEILRGLLLVFDVLDAESMKGTVEYV